MLIGKLYDDYYKILAIERHEKGSFVCVLMNGKLIWNDSSEFEFFATETKNYNVSMDDVNKYYQKKYPDVHEINIYTTGYWRPL